MQLITCSVANGSNHNEENNHDEQRKLHLLAECAVFVLFHLPPTPPFYPPPRPPVFEDDFF